jgi:fused signal recognition particle receptor
MRNTKEQFWQNQERVFKEWKQKEQERNAKALAEQKKSTRVRLEEAMMAREAEIRKMALERKNFGREAKAEREQEAKALNDELLEEKRQSVLRRRQLKDECEALRQRDLSIARALREEMLALSAVERQQEAQADAERGSLLREQHREARRIAKEEEDRRLRENAEAVQAMHKKQKKRQDVVAKLRKDILDIKAATVKTLRTGLQADLVRAVSQLEEEKANAAGEVKKAQRNRADEYQRLLALRVEDRRNIATGLREQQQASRKQYEDDRKNMLQMMQQQARQQREDAKALQEEEMRVQREEHQEYIRMMRELAAGKRTEANRSRSASPPRSEKKKNVRLSAEDE